MSLIYCIFNDWPFDPGATYPAIWISTSAPLEIREYAIKPEPSADEFFGLFATYSNGSVGGDNAGTGALKIKALYDAQNFIHIEGEAEFDYELSDGRTINIFINEFTAQYHPPIIRS
nr:hypothetical protein [Pseudomonas sp. BIGb0427]